MASNNTSEQLPDAYDINGRPLYYHPPVAVPSAPVSKQSTKDRQALVKLRRERSRADYPDLQLANDEYVEICIVRHKIGLLYIWVGEIVAIVLLLAAWVVFLTSDITHNFIPTADDVSTRINFTIIIFALIAITLVFGWIGTILFRKNRLIITNYRAVQDVMTGLFDKRTQTIDLVSVEDVSYHQSGIFQHLLNYGSIRLSTIGKETAYNFTFVCSPKEQVKGIVKLVNNAKTRRRKS